MPRERKTAEHRRLEEAARGIKWRRWGTYLSERQWGTVREDYSPAGDAWTYFPHDHARSRAYRWGEDGILGLCDNRGITSFAVALWNGRDPILKERFFGLSGEEGNHGEDVKELYWYLAQTPTCTYAKALYKYPQREFPYEKLLAMARANGRNGKEPELLDTGVFDEDRYFDVQVEYAKANVEDLLIRYTVTNRGPEEAELHVLPTLWFRNTWAWGGPQGVAARPELRAIESGCEDVLAVESVQSHLGPYVLYAEGAEDLLFSDNETNAERIFGCASASRYVKDAFHRYVVHGERPAVNPARIGTKACAKYVVRIGPGERAVLRLRYTKDAQPTPFAPFDEIFLQRIVEHDDLYDAVMPQHLGDDERNVYTQAMGGLLWTKQFYYYDCERWIRGDTGQPSPPSPRMNGRNCDWRHLYNSEVLSMPDKWEYPWYAAWDLAFHCIPLALVDPELAKQQLSLLTREWYMHPNGQLPAYEWAFGDVNPPVHAWAAYRVYQIEKRQTGHADRAFLESVFHKLMLNFTWWVNRKDAAGKNVFQGGFLGLDNIGVFDRSSALPGGGTLEQADATSWMGMYCLNLLAIALELARHDPVYQDVANKFFEHFLYIAHAMQDVAGAGIRLWDEDDGFFYDVMHLPHGGSFAMKLRSMVGLIPLFAVETLPSFTSERFPSFEKRMEWFLTNRPELSEHIASVTVRGAGERRLLSVLDRGRLVRVLRRMLDEDEFLSPYGIRSLSRVHAREPYILDIQGTRHRVDYEPAESKSGLFGGNSNWRGPVWFPVNYLIIESLQKYHHYYGDDLKVECPTGSGTYMTLWEVASELSRRLVRLFVRGEDGRRPAHGYVDRLQKDPHFRDHVTFFEYFHGDNGAGIGAAHQTGWTALVAKLLQQSSLWDLQRDP